MAVEVAAGKGSTATHLPFRLAQALKERGAREHPVHVVMKGFGLSRQGNVDPEDGKSPEQGRNRAVEQRKIVAHEKRSVAKHRRH